MKNKIIYILIFLLVLYPSNIFADGKKEVVYTSINRSGEVKDISVVNHLLSEDKEIIDETNLSNITNINGDEKFKLDGNTLTWNRLDSDIYYKGESDETLPVELSIKYYLDDKEYDYKSIKGKKGHITIKIDYINNDRHLISNKEVYTPFMVVTSMTLSSNNTNIEVNSGKVVETGTNNVVVGLSSPGLSDSFNSSILDEYNTLIIEYDTTKFSYNNLYIVATPKLISNLDIDNINNKVDSLSSSINLLNSNMDKIDSGASSLNEGIGKYKEGLEEAINTLKNTSVNALSDKELELIKESSLNSVDELFTDSYKEEIANNAWNEVRDNMDENDENVINIVKSGVEVAIYNYLNDSNNLNNYYMCNNNLLSSDSDICINLNNNINLIKNYSSIASSYTASNTSSYVAEKVSKEVSKEVSYNTATKVAETMSITIAENVANAVKNTSMETISKLLNTLYNGIIEIDNGSNSLASGISEYNKSGIDALSSKVSIINDYKDTVSKLTNLSKNYKGYGCNNSSSTTFIYKVKNK